MSAKTPSHPVRAGYNLAAWILLGLWIGLLGWQMVIRFPWRWEAVTPLLQWGRFSPWSGKVFLLHGTSTLAQGGLFLAFLISAHGLGRWCFLRVFSWGCSRLETLLYSLGLGFSLLALLIFILGLLGGYHPLAFGLILAGLSVFGVWITGRDWAKIKPAGGWRLSSWVATDKLLLGVMAAWMLVVMVLVNTPETFFDSLVYHLAVPEQWIQAGGIHPLPHNFFSYLPMNIEMLYTGALLLGDERLCRMLHAGLSALGGLTIFALGRRWFNPRTGLWALGLTLTIPVLTMNMVASGVDGGAAFFGLLAVAAWMEWCVSTSPASPQRRYLLTAAWFTGAALACKYNEVFVLAPALVLGVALNRGSGRHWRTLLGSGVLFAVVACIPLAPWLIKNIAYTGNPVYPFLYRFLPSPNIHPEKMQQQMDGFREYSQRTPWQWLRQPWDLTFYPATSNSYAGVAFLFLFPGMLLGIGAWRRGPPQLKFIMLTLIFSALLWATQTQIMRYFIPAFPLLALLGAWVLDRWESWQPAFGQVARWAVLAFVLWGGMVTLNIAALNWDPVGVALGLEERTSYLRRKLMNNYTEIAEAVNRLPSSSKVLFHGETRAYYFKRLVTAATVYDFHPLLEHTARAEHAEAVWQWLRQSGYTHIYIHYPEAARTRGYEPYIWTDAALDRWRALMAFYLKPESRYGQQVLYRVLDKPAPDQPLRRGRPLFTYDPGTIDKATQHYSQAIAALQQGRVLDAHALLVRITELAPDWDVPYLELAWLYRRVQRPAEALAMYQHADALVRLDPASANNAGVLSMEGGTREQAEHYFRLALDENPELEAARKNLDAVRQERK